MQEQPPVVVLRLGHRPGRDERTTTHVGLTARALGADRLVLEDVAEGRRETVADITDRFGGPFDVEVTDQPLGRIRSWDGRIAHLTMYGEPIQDIEDDLQAARRQDPLLVVVGAEKVPFEVYEHADWNVGVTNQPHSEIAALAVFLDRLFDGTELDREWKDADQRVVPKETGKRVVEAGDTPES
ncbi:tRNA (cytidine(56)-2'-O)-methyltransferase [Halorhabdus rudnickae]|uniref:tRNA (cytidine(56)-2'-O)-methyltransferase n=1 Tax=Halorhabdus rudnickae TaxID=1775544 RepID=UPI00108332A5|nr:tRNA (cytidine(56)-2'-O)-methyltransferase [Halorhabdus rudnickae]